MRIEVNDTSCLTAPLCVNEFEGKAIARLKRFIDAANYLASDLKKALEASSVLLVVESSAGWSVDEVMVWSQALYMAGKERGQKSGSVYRRVEAKRGRASWKRHER